MNTNNNYAPEKLYLNWTEYPLNEMQVEYTRSDAFIEKACDAYCKVCGHYAHKTPTYICRQACDYYKNFRNYMKGE